MYSLCKEIDRLDQYYQLCATSAEKLERQRMQFQCTCVVPDTYIRTCISLEVPVALVILSTR